MLRSPTSHRPGRLAVLLCLLLTFPHTTPAAKTWHVDCANTTGSEDGSAVRPYSTITAALNVARGADEVLVTGGCTYVENLLVGSGIRVIGLTDPNGVGPTVDGGRRSNTVVIAASDPNTTFTGFTITGGRGSNGGGLFVSGNPSVTKNVIHGNRAIGFLSIGGAARGGGIFVTGDALIADNRIVDNTSVGGFGGGISVGGGSPTITRNLIQGNRALAAADGVYGYGGGIAVSRAVVPSITSNVIVGNRADRGGGGIDVYVTRTAVAGNSIAGNTAGRAGRRDGFGGGIQITGVTSSSGLDAAVMNNLFLYNSATVDGGGADILFSQPVFRSNNFFGNTTTQVTPPSRLIGRTGNIALDPNFGINPALPVDPAALVPGPGFPHVDAGERGVFCVVDQPGCPAATGGDQVAVVALGALDHVGNPRVTDGDADGAGRPELGAFEVVPGTPPDDVDADGVLAPGDNCPSVYNPGQEDGDLDPNGVSDGFGDACDNCPAVHNPGQEDFDTDLVGDACDADADNDLVPEDADGDPNTITPCTGGAKTGCDDNCLLRFNDAQTDPDRDGVGNACDNCPSVYNPSQTDTDGDALGDACDNCPAVPNGDCFASPRFCSIPPDPDPNVVSARESTLGFLIDSNGNGVGNACEPDLDGDGIPTDRDGDPNTLEPCTGGATTDCDDNCPFNANATQADTDADGVGDVCDNCPDDANPIDPNSLVQLDRDNDGTGDACDPDADGDGIPEDGNNSGMIGDPFCPVYSDPNTPLANCDDNCPGFLESTQANLDGDPNFGAPFPDTLGDVCDDDDDGDGVLEDGDASGSITDARCTGGATTMCDDNCPRVINPMQEDADGDLVGDACDNCPAVPNSFQQDQDADGIGNVCDDDVDGDGILDQIGDGDPNTFTPCTGGATTGCDDNCPFNANAMQEDDDGDLRGNACDNCPGDANPSQADLDSDQIGDACDADADGDQVTDTVDNCLFFDPALIDLSINPLQNDFDRDGVGDECDTDSDGDGIEELFGDGDPDVFTPCTGGATEGCDDNCPFLANPTQADADGDGLGDACDTCPAAALASNSDSDRDGLGDLCDNCPNRRNITQSDGDADGIGNACDRPDVRIGLLGPTRTALGASPTFNVVLRNRLDADVTAMWSLDLQAPGGGVTAVTGATPVVVPALTIVRFDVVVPWPASPAGRWVLIGKVIPTTGEPNLHTARKAVRAR